MNIIKGQTKAKKPPRIIVYGPPKIGKSTLGSEAPAPVFVTTEDGIDNVPVDAFPKAITWTDVLGNIEQVAKDKHENKTLVLDTLNGATELASRYVCEKMFANDWGAKGFQSFGQGWTATSEEMRRLLDPLDACRARGMNVILLAHTGVQSVKNPVFGDFSKYQGDVDKKIWARFAAWADIILRADYDYTVLGASADGKQKGRVTSSSARILRCVGSAAEDAGCRVGYELPDVIDLSWQAIESNLGGKSELVDDVRAKWQLLSAEEAKKTLVFLGIASLDKLDTVGAQKVATIANRLKTKEVANVA